MGLHRGTPPLSGRMGALWCLSGIADAAVVEYGCMGHMAYGRTFLHRMGSSGGRLYSTHIGEIDIAMGDIGRLARAIEQVSEIDGVKAIFLLPSSIPEVMGIDLDAVATELAPRAPDTDLIPLSVGGFDACGHEGVTRTLSRLVEVLPRDVGRTEEPTFNIIGSCADLFRFEADSAELSRIISGAFSARRLCTMTSDCSLSDLGRLGSAHFNVVIRREGEQAARCLQKRFGTPYLMARPYGIQGTIDWIRQMEAVAGLSADREFIRRERRDAEKRVRPMQAVLTRFLRAHGDESSLVVAGHADVVSGVAEFGEGECGFARSRRYCDCSAMSCAEMPCLEDEVERQLASDRSGFLMGGAELLRRAERDESMQISLPDDRWHHAYEPPFVGFRGAVNLMSIWANEMMRKD